MKTYKNLNEAIKENGEIVKNIYTTNKNDIRGRLYAFENGVEVFHTSFANGKFDKHKDVLTTDLDVAPVDLEK